MKMSKLMKRLFIQDVLVMHLFSLFLSDTGGLKVVAPSEVGFVYGENVSLPCTFTMNEDSGPIDLSKLELEWIRGPTILLTYKNGKIEPSSLYKGRVMMNEQNLRNGDATLNLNNVTKVDMITCIVAYSGETRRVTINLSCKLFVHCPEFIVASPGQESTFTCNFSPGSHEVPITIDFPAFSIEWYDSNEHSIARFSKIREHYMDGLSMSVSEEHHGTFSLTFKSVKPDDYGNYTCKVNYPHYITGSAVTALYKGHVMVKSTQTVEVTPGEDLEFIYTLSLNTQEGSPSIDDSLLSIEFYKDSNKNPLYLFQNGEEQVLDGRMNISRIPNGDSFILLLKDVELHHYGTYTCTIRYPNYKEGSASTILLIRSEEKHQKFFSGLIFGVVATVVLALLGVLVWCYWRKTQRFVKLKHLQYKTTMQLQAISLLSFILLAGATANIFFEETPPQSHLQELSKALQPFLDSAEGYLSPIAHKTKVYAELVAVKARQYGETLAQVAADSYEPAVDHLKVFASELTDDASIYAEEMAKEAKSLASAWLKEVQEQAEPAQARARKMAEVAASEARRVGENAMQELNRWLKELEEQAKPELEKVPEMIALRLAEVRKYTEDMAKQGQELAQQIRESQEGRRVSNVIQNSLTSIQDFAESIEEHVEELAETPTQE